MILLCHSFDLLISVVLLRLKKNRIHLIPIVLNEAMLDASDHCLIFLHAHKGLGVLTFFASYFDLAFKTLTVLENSVSVCVYVNYATLFSRQQD